MRHFTIYTRKYGNQKVKAETARQAIACIVARLKLTEQEAMQVIRWAVSTDKEVSDGAAT